MELLEEIAQHIELHSVDGIRGCFARGVNPNDYYRSEPLINELTSEYTRSPRFKECVKVFVENGLEFDDKVLLAVLTDDAESLAFQLARTPEALSRRYSLRCAYTPLYEVSLLHICAEFNHVSCAEVLVGSGADINAKAGLDSHGFGGQTPVFHSVNQNSNQSLNILEFLLSKSADLDITVTGFIWGEGYSWETFIPSVNPISYTMMGLLPQMHRDPKAISQVVSMLLKKEYGIDYIPDNIPCKYLDLG